MAEEMVNDRAPAAGITPEEWEAKCAFCGAPADAPGCCAECYAPYQAGLGEGRAQAKEDVKVYLKLRGEFPHKAGCGCQTCCIVRMIETDYAKGFIAEMNEIMGG